MKLKNQSKLNPGKTILLRGFLSAIITIGCSGCMTMISFSVAEEACYSGVRLSYTTMFCQTEESGYEDGLGLWGNSLMTLDMPFSLVLDTLLLPITIPIEIFKAWNPAEEAE